MAINLQQFLAKQLSDGAIDQQLCDLLNAVADLSKEINAVSYTHLTLPTTPYV